MEIKNCENASSLSHTSPVYVVFLELYGENDKRLFIKFFLESCPQFMAFLVNRIGEEKRLVNAKFKKDFRRYLLVFRCFEPLSEVELEHELRLFGFHENNFHILPGMRLNDKRLFDFIQAKLQSHHSGDIELEALLWRVTEGFEKNYSPRHRLWNTFFQKCKAKQGNKTLMAANKDSCSYLAGQDSFLLEIPVQANNFGTNIEMKITENEIPLMKNNIISMSLPTSPVYVVFAESFMAGEQAIRNFFLENCPQYMAFVIHRVGVEKRLVKTKLKHDFRQYLFVFKCFEPWSRVEIERRLRVSLFNEHDCRLLPGIQMTDKRLFDFIEEKLQADHSGDIELEALLWRVTEGMENNSLPMHPLWKNILKECKELQRKRTLPATVQANTNYLVGITSFIVEIPAQTNSFSKDSKKSNEEFSEAHSTL